MELNISQELVDKAANEALNNLLKTDNYSNPIKKLIEAEFSWDMQGEGKTDLAKQLKIKINETISRIIDDPDFHKVLGEQIAIRFAEAAVKDLRHIKELQRK